MGCVYVCIVCYLICYRMRDTDAVVVKDISFSEHLFYISAYSADIKYQHSADAALSRCASDSENPATLELNILFLDDALEDQRRYVSVVN